MKFIFSFLFGILLISPVFAECNSTTPANDCTCAGWGWDNNTGECKSCNYYEYSPANDSICHPCATQNSDNTWTWSITPPTPNSIFDYDNASNGQSECPWKCDADNGYYKNNAGTACIACPNGNHFIEESEPQQNISQCSCSGGKHLIYTTFTNSNNETMYKYFCGYCYEQNIDNSVSGLVSTDSNNITTCNCGVINANDNYSSSSQMCACPNGATFGTDSCKCPADHYMQTVAGVSSCEHCPDHAHSPAGSDEKNDCQCTEAGFETANYDTNNILESCTACGANAEYHNGTCMCKPNYYGNGQECTRCPPGTKKDEYNGYSEAPSTVSVCHMSSATKFCTGSGNDKKCMQLIPNNATNINQSGN